ncbi:metal-sensing transcriptional repressor [Veillonella sp.]|uniref:metal-sensing transcriptional repressor n=1 Tax=Veillonella sp. TaxID=1926307 RepID=UPI0025F8B840|nr:metal-sensing transcriptional repressor [Veillonella sp.]
MSQESHELLHAMGIAHNHTAESVTEQAYFQEHNHDHSHDEVVAALHSHGHSHSHTQTKAVLNRLSRIAGHLESVKRMVESGRDCSEVLVQLAAVGSAVKSVSRVVMKDHIEHCIVDAVKNNDTETLKKLNEAIDRFIK